MALIRMMMPMRSALRRSVGLFSSDVSDADFAPEKKAQEYPYPTDPESIEAMIKEHLGQFPVMLYMKGTPDDPMCGFSLHVVQILQAEGVSFSSVDCIRHPIIFEGIKDISKWNTLPQLFVEGEFVGGADLVHEMHTSGELKALFASVFPGGGQGEEEN